ncbi:MAG: PKD domain-containing protein [Chitinophagaceae bacterium]|nr:PKD domain-containing protein [Chitinophagaceae bacterium]
MKKIVCLTLLLVVISIGANTQCVSPINSFPYTEDFETTDGGWVSGGAGNDWTWGTPSKPVITGAGGGVKCWVVGGLTGSSYTNAEASWIQSPCFDFTNLQYPYIEFKVFWETEQQFDGGGFQYSIDNGASWINVGAANDAINCLNSNWFNHSSITYLAPLSSDRNGWSGNIQASAGSCRGGNGSNKWLTAKHTMPYLAGRAGVIFRFIFGAGTICNSYDGFAVDDISIKEAPPNAAAFTYACVGNNTANFKNASALCPATFNWDFGDLLSGGNNTSSLPNPSHAFSAPGKYTITLTVTGPGNAPSTTTKDIYIIRAEIDMLQMVDCQTNTGGSLIVTVEGAPGITLNTVWNTVPPQTTPLISGLSEGFYNVAISGTDVCPITAVGKAEKDISCIGIFFPSAFTPDGDGKNDAFGPLGSLFDLKEYKFGVYNRWGERVFYSTNPFEKWNGTVKESRTDGNLFIWMAEFVLPGKTKEMRKGFVVLIR